jgi:glucose/arabinose dehydrogenase
MGFLRRALVTFASAMVVCFSAAGADPKFVKPPAEFTCRWTDLPIVIDGKADDAAWKDAAVIDTFHLPWLGAEARAARTKTQARLLWDREYLYFFADLEDGDLFADLTEHDDKLWQNDVFELFLKPAIDKDGYYEFQVNAAGATLDMFLPKRFKGSYDKHKSDHEFHFEAKVVLKGTLNQRDDRDRGWTVEGRLPWTDFLKTGGRPDIGEKWKFALCRYDYDKKWEKPELSTIAPLDAVNFHQHENYATLTFEGPPAQSRKPYGIEKRVPLTTSRVVGSPDPPPPYKAERVFPKLALTNPVAVVRVPGVNKMLLITEPKSYGTGEIQIIPDDPAIEAGDVLLELKGTAYDIAFHPKYAENGYLYVGWNGANADGKKSCKITRYTMPAKGPYKLDPATETLILEWQSDGHNGAALCFGLDGMLYITSGDGTSDSDTNVTGQRMDLLLAKCLRIDVDHPDEGKAYSVPNDNPFVGQENVRPETWAFGFRNPWRIHCDAKTGHLWVGNNGQDLWEQIYFVRKGENYGWSVYEGGHPFYLERKLGPTPHVKPTLEHPHSEARSLTGGIVYYGTKHPDLVGAYIYGDYSTGRIWAAKHDGEKILWHKEIAQTRLQITGFGTDSQGELLICDHASKKEGGLYTLTPTPKNSPPSTFPRKLSDSGLFESVQGHRLMPSLIPYSVNAPLWSDGAIKARWLGLPGDAKLEYHRSNTWKFPDQTVIVKSFALELEEGKPQSKRWIETRFFTKQDKEWHGYSYIWNDEQTDATLVEAGGLDKEFTIQTAGGERKQKWRYPSRAECMVCHSRAANWVLGLSEPQLNRDHDYGGCVDNQLRVLEHLELLPKFNYAQQVREIVKADLEKKKRDEKEIAAALAKLNSAAGQRLAPTTSLLAFNPERFNQFADPYDPKADINSRARAYLHSNCASCHVEAGGGNALFNVAWNTPIDKMKLFDVKPAHHTFGLTDARLVAPGHPERSVLLRRVATREPGHMPPLASSVVDQQAVKMLRQWIEQMPARKDD